MSLASPMASYVPTLDLSLSGTGADLWASIEGALTAEGSVISRRREEAKERIVAAVTKAAADNVSITPSTYERALSVLRSLPSDFPLPDVIVEDDGEIGLDWDEDARQVLTVSVGEGPMLRYAALIGAEPAHGRVSFAGGTLPITLSFYLKRLYA